MWNYNLIFSEEKRVRLKRHLLFWLCWWLHFGILHAANAFGKKEISFFNNLPFTITESVFLLIPQIIVTYLVIYFILPRYLLKNKIWAAFFLTTLIWFAAAIVNVLIHWYVIPNIITMILPDRFLQKTGRDKNTSFYMAILVLFKGALVPAGIALAIKAFKSFWLKEQRNLQLQKENAEAQLQLLTAQVHPHFLFNTLNNIYSQTQMESPKSSRMILNLSDLLRYALYEGRKLQVPLSKELEMINHYINLERIRYGNKLDVHLITPDNAHNVLIAPMLMLPFLENAFKHGTSHMIEQPWINLKIVIDKNILTMKLMNGKMPEEQPLSESSGIGIENVKKRLALLYPGKHELLITNDKDVFVVDLKMELAYKSIDNNSIELPDSEKTIVYA